MDGGMMMRLSLGYLMRMLPLCVSAAWPAAAPAGPAFRPARVKVPVRCIDYAFAVETSAAGVPVFNWSRFESRPRRVITRTLNGIVLENRLLRVTLIPSM